MLKIGVLGAGHLGKIHIKCIKQIAEYELVGFYDTDTENARKTADELQVKSFSSADELVDSVEVVDIVTPTIAHYPSAAAAIAKKKHIFIEKPITTTIGEAEKLIRQSQEAGVKVQIGHVERFNPAFLAARPFLSDVKFIENHRLAQFNPRGTDVPVVLDLMIHDIDIVLSVIKAKIRTISASGVAVISQTPDIANARLEFEDGSVANLTASRLSMKNMRKTRFFQRDAYISVDFLEKNSEVVRMKSIDNQKQADPYAMVLDLGEKGAKQIFIENPEIKPINAIKTELESFYHAIVNNTTPPVTIDDGYKALDVAYKIMDKIQQAARRAGNFKPRTDS